MITDRLIIEISAFINSHYSIIRSDFQCCDLQILENALSANCKKSASGLRAKPTGGLCVVLPIYSSAVKLIF